MLRWRLWKKRAAVMSDHVISAGSTRDIPAESEALKRLVVELSTAKNDRLTPVGPFIAIHRG